jgi:hypothetical protein
MAFIYEELQLFLVIPKLIEATTLTATAVVIRRKSQYILNKVYFLAFFLWGIIAYLDSIMYVIAPNGAIFLAVANFGRDLGAALLNGAWFSFLFASLIISRGKQEALKRKNLVIALVWYVIIVIGTIITDNMVILNTDSGEAIPPEQLPPAAGIPFKVTAIVTPASALFISSTLVLLIISIVLMARVLRNIKESAERRRIQLFLTGLALLLAGSLYFLIIVGLKLYTFEAYTIGYLLWTFAPIFTLFGVRRNPDEAAK